MDLRGAAGAGLADCEGAADWEFTQESEEIGSSGPVLIYI
jgi:hypothetical protein